MLARAQRSHSVCGDDFINNDVTLLKMGCTSTIGDIYTGIRANTQTLLPRPDSYCIAREPIVEFQEVSFRRMKPKAASIALIACILLGLYASLGECIIGKRQSQLCSDDRAIEIIMSSIPAECFLALSNFSVDDCGEQCFSALCNETCARPIHEYRVKCYDDASVELYCSRNEKATPCYNETVNEVERLLRSVCDPSNSTYCSPGCMIELADDSEFAGCCLYTYYALVSTTQLWDVCNIDIPGVCTSKFTGEPIKVPRSGQVTEVPGSGEVTVTGCIFVLVAALLMASTSLN